MLYTIFVRNWWKENPNWPEGLEPDGAARKRKIDEAETEEEAQVICAEYRRTHSPGRLSRKAEYTRTDYFSSP